MLLSELNLKALNINAQTILPVEQIIDVEGKVLKIRVINFQSNYGSGKKTVVSGTISLNDANHTSTELNNSDIEALRRKVARLIGLKNTGDRKPRKPKEQTEVIKSEVEKLRDSLAVARRLPKGWINFNAKEIRQAFKDARKKDRAPQKLASLTNLDTEKQLKAYELLKKAGLI